VATAGSRLGAARREIPGLKPAIPPNFSPGLKARASTLKPLCKSEGLKPLKFLWGLFRVALKGHPPRTEGPGLTQNPVLTQTLKPFLIAGLMAGLKSPCEE
jgi:hypothetical protein